MELILWDIVEEHLEEAGFLWGRWEAALEAPDYRLCEVAEIEQRLFAHVEGLLVGGAPVASRVLLPALSDQDPELVFAAAYTLLSSGVTEQAAAVLDALEQADAEQLPAVRRALELGPLAGLQQRLRALAAEGPSGLRAAALDVLTAHGVQAGELLERFLATRDPLLLGAGLRAARLPGAPLLTEHLRRAMDHPDLAVRDAALESAMIRRLPAARERCQALVAARDRDCGHALLLLALAGQAQDIVLIHGCLDRPGLRHAAIRALGFTGTREAAGLCLEALDTDDLQLARLAGEALSTITGIDLELAELALPVGQNGEQDPDDEQPGGPQPPEQYLPIPDAAALAAWWDRQQEQLEPGVRHHAGRPADLSTLLEALQYGPARRRRLLALELALRTAGGGQQLRTDAWSNVQQRQLQRSSILAQGLGEQGPGA